MLSLTACPDNSGKSRFTGKTLKHILFFFLLLTQICFAQWYQQNSGTTKNLNAVHFVDANNGCAVGDSGTIIHTTNAGVSWETQTSGTTNGLSDIQFIDANTGWAVGSSGIILKTTNGGAEWVLQAIGDSLILNAICFINDSIGWVVGWSHNGSIGYIPIILKTANGGINWIFQLAPSGWPINDVYFIDANIGFIAGGMECGDGGDGVILKTTNGGDIWVEQTAQSSICWYGISFSDEQNGIIVGNRRAALAGAGIIFRTTDGGINWLLAFEEPMAGANDIAINSVTFLDFSHAWAVEGPPSYYPAPGKILFSSDAGINWFSQGEFQNSLQSVCFSNSSTGWVVGQSGIILQTTNGGVTFTDNELPKPTDFILEQNYPNPFNPSTTIKFQIPEQSFVTIKVYDVLGNEIATLVNEYKPAGTYEVEFNTSSINHIPSSGIYFYQLKAGS
ncbi:MAG: T9SS type A sorting domain-containing protein, partial [Ignavibacteriaceae bacterium]|nr:T9SS type A sorting domain-containing protein [Ignavibacteriaceae bacterium]